MLKLYKPTSLCSRKKYFCSGRRRGGGRGSEINLFLMNVGGRKYAWDVGGRWKSEIRMSYYMRECWATTMPRTKSLGSRR